MVEVSARFTLYVDAPIAFKAHPITRIKQAVAARHGLTVAELCSPRRTPPLVRSRWIAIYLAKTLTKCGMCEIGRRFGGRDHSTVHHAIKRVERLMAEDPDYAAEVQSISAGIVPW